MGLFKPLVFQKKAKRGEGRLSGAPVATEGFYSAMIPV